MVLWRVFPVVAGLALATLPLAPNLDTGGVVGAAALAKPGGGNGGGHGGGKGGKGHGAASADRTADAGKAAGKASGKNPGRGDRSSGRGLALGRDKDRDAVSGLAAGRQDLDATKHGLTASSLGRLNAAHASARARERAAPHSAVGLIDQYADAIAAGDLEAAAAALAAAANKDIDLAVVGALNDLLNIELDAADEQEIADQASEAQAAETSNGLGPGGSPEGDEDHSE